MVDDKPLFRQLDDVELKVLELVLEPLRSTGVYPPVWPTRDFVARRLAKEYPGSDLDAVLVGLPTVAGLYRDRRYGLVWTRSNPDWPGIDGDFLGLTIMGFKKLRETGRLVPPIDDLLMEVLHFIAASSAEMTPDPTRVVHRQIGVQIGDLAVPTRQKPMTIPVEQVVDVLRFEFAPMNFTSSAGEHHAELSGSWLTPFADLRTADGYEQLISDLVAAAAGPVDVTESLPLIQTLDYLSYVLADDRRWPKGVRLVGVLDLESAAAFGRNVETAQDFQTAIGGVWNVLGQLAVPDVDEALVASRYEGKQPGSIARLREWIASEVGPGALARLDQPLHVLSAVGRIRVADAHGSTTTRQEAIRARRLLGLPEVIGDWSHAWATVAGHLAWAFDAIRREIQAPPLESEEKVES